MLQNLMGITSIRDHARMQTRPNPVTEALTRLSTQGLSQNAPQNAVQGGDREESQPMSQHDRMMQMLRESTEDNRRAMQIIGLEGRMMSGGRLTSDEMSFLRENAPHLYEKAVKIAHERAEFEREMRNARSKEDVANIHQRRMNQFAVEAGDVVRSGRPRAERDSAMRFIHMRMMAISNEHVSFLNTSQYRALPDESDQNSVTITTRLERDESIADPVRILNDFFAENEDYEQSRFDMEL